jgi:hypothetical protein
MTHAQPVSAMASLLLGLRVFLLGALAGACSPTSSVLGQPDRNPTPAAPDRRTVAIHGAGHGRRCRSCPTSFVVWGSVPHDRVGGGHA